MKQKVLIISAGWEQEPMLKKLKEMRLYADFFLVHYNNDYSKTLQYKDVLVCDVRELSKILEFAKKHKVSAVISDECDYSYFAQAVVCEELSLHGPRIKEAQVAVNKLLQRQLAKKNGVTVPKFKLCADTTDVYDFIDKVGLPVIVKPVDNRGSIGVVKIEKKDDVASAFTEAMINSHSRLVLVEEFIVGVQITIDGYVFKKHGARSISLATKDMHESKEVAMQIVYPGKLSKKLYEKAIKTNEDTINKLGYAFGMTHAEYMIRGSKIFLIEAANRGGGVHTSNLIAPTVSGVDIVSQYIYDCLNIKKDFYKTPEKHSTILKFFSLKKGKIKTISLPKKVPSNILACKFLVKDGDKISDITSDANRHGFVIITEQKNIQKEFDDFVNTIEVSYDGR